MTGFVYFLRCGDFVKIGYSTKPKARFRALQTALPFEVELLGLHEGTKQHERWLHKIFSLLHHHHEWFRVDESILQIVKNGLPHIDGVIEPPTRRSSEISFSIFQKLGGEKAALDVIAAAEGKRPSADSLGKWKHSGRIPPLRAVVLMRECTRRHIIASYDEDCSSVCEVAA